MQDRTQQRHSTIKALEKLKQAVLQKFVTHPDFHPKQENGKWVKAAIATKTPLARDLIKRVISPDIDYLLGELELAMETCLKNACPLDLSGSTYQDTIAEGPEALVRIEYQQLHRLLKNLPLSDLDLEDRLHLVRGTSTRSSLDYIHGSLIVQARQFCDEIDRSKTLLAALADDPSKYIDSLVNRRWDAANTAFAQYVDQDSVSQAQPWKMHDDIWVREFVIETDTNERLESICSVRFGALKPHVEAMNVSGVTLKENDPANSFDIEPY